MGRADLTDLITDQDVALIESTQNKLMIEKEDPSGDWPDPEEIKATLLPVEQLPPQIIPEPLRDWVLDVSYRMQVKPDIVAIGVIVVAGATIGTACGIRPKQKDNWLVIPNLWGAVVSDPGTLKTPALQEATGPLNCLETEAKAKYDEEFDYHEAEREVCKAKKDALKSEMQKAARGKGCSDLEELKLQMMSLEEPDPPVWKRYVTNDSTIEKMAEILKQNPRGILLFRDELVGLFSTWDKDGREADRAFYLEAWNGFGSITTDRIGRGTVHVDNLCLSVLGGIQPAKMLAYLYQTASALDNDGLVQRLQMFVYPDKLAKWELIDEFPDRAAKEITYGAIKNLAEMDFAEYGAEQGEDGSIVYLHFSEEAQELFNEWLTELQEKLQADEMPFILEHLAKYRSLMPSLALIDHLLNIADDKASGPVSLESAQKAAAWCCYLESHARRIYGLMGDIGQRAAVELAKKIKSKNLPNDFSIRDVYRNGWHLLTTKEAVKAACAELEEAGWLKSYLAQDGRTRTLYQINPKIYL